MLYEGEGTSSWTRNKVSKNGSVPLQEPRNNESTMWQESMMRGQTNHANGTLPAMPSDAQKYYILDRDNVNAMNA